MAQQLLDRGYPAAGVQELRGAGMPQPAGRNLNPGAVTGRSNAAAVVEIADFGVDVGELAKELGFIWAP